MCWLKTTSQFLCFVPFSLCFSVSLYVCLSLCLSLSFLSLSLPIFLSLFLSLSIFLFLYLSLSLSFSLSFSLSLSHYLSLPYFFFRFGILKAATFDRWPKQTANLALTKIEVQKMYFQRLAS